MIIFDGIISTGVYEDVYIFGECKWRNQLCGVEVYQKLVEKSFKYFVFQNAYYFLFSKSGFSDDLIKIAKKDKRIVLFKNTRDQN